MHDHLHTHEHATISGHPHADAVSQTQAQTVSSEERLALLKYMVHHNAHHAEELHELAHGVDGEAAEWLHKAVADIEESNKKIEAALALLEK